MNRIIVFFILIYLFFTNSIASTIDDIKILQNNFHHKVIVTHTFKKRFDKYLKKRCPTQQSKCYTNSIKIIQSWDTTKNDDYLINKLFVLNNHNNEISKSWNDINTKLINLNTNLTKTQFVSLIDISKQLYILSVWDQDINQFLFVGADLISTGDISCEVNIKYGEDHYLETPNGVFKVKSGWRSEGKKLDDNFTMPYGQKNRYIYYFGKQKSIRYNSFDSNKTKIKDPNKYKLITDELEFAMHAHKSYKSLGIKASHGCVRMSNELNLFLDNNYVLHKDLYVNNKWQHKYIPPPKSSNNTNLSGEYLIVFDKI